MNKFIPLFAGMLSVGTVFSQTFSDDFESYTAGDLIGNSTEWDTWSGSGGGTDDVPVSDAMAHSGTNSLHFLATGTGGPGDIVKDFGSEISTGSMDFEVWVYVNSGKTAYFNFQKESTIGNTWALDLMFQNGELEAYNTSNSYITTTYPEDTWFKINTEMNFNTNSWELLVDGTSVGSFSNSENQVASLNIYSIEDADFYIDDISYTHTPYTLQGLNAAITHIDPNAVLSGQISTPSIKLRNLGLSTVNSVELSISYDGNNYTESLSSLNLLSLAETTIELSTSFGLANGTNDLTVSITNVNGNGLDDDANDDSQTIAITPIEVFPGRMVFGEEGTGTWCGWCPRGAVAMDEMEIEFHDFWAGVAVHNNDPMANDDYDAAIGNLINGYPSALVDRGPDIDPSDMRQDFLTRIATAPAAVIEMGAEFNATTRELKMSLSAEFLEAANSDYQLAIIVIEDSVTGTGSGYNQSNYYGSQNIELIDPAGFDWSDLPSSVPAADMIYNHVARDILPNFNGMTNCLPATVNIGETHVINAKITLEPEWDETKIKIIGILIEPNGDVNNAGKASLDEAVNNGYVLTTDNFTFNYVDNLFELYPNPTSNISYVKLQDVSNANVVIYDISGQIILEQELTQVESSLDLSNFAKGMYTVEISSGEKLQVKKLIVK